MLLGFSVPQGYTLEGSGQLRISRQPGQAVPVLGGGVPANLGKGSRSGWGHPAPSSHKATVLGGSQVSSQGTVRIWLVRLPERAASAVPRFKTGSPCILVKTTM